MHRLSDYDYDLPEDRIAQTPLQDRSSARLLVLRRPSGRVEHRRFTELPDLLEPGDLLVLNDTRVTAIRLEGRKPTGGKVELLLLREERPGVYRALGKPGRSLRVGAKVEMAGGLAARVVADLGAGLREVEFERTTGLVDRLFAVGSIPLPPYIHADIRDPGRYQTVYAREPGSSAAPTAGLHFTPELLEALRAKGVGVASVTLDIGLDTFRPVRADDLSHHRMHGERCGVGEEAANAINSCAGRIVAVGTTVVRTLETHADGMRRVRPGETVSHLFIRPGFRFQVVDCLLTNFHLPRTTMLMLVCALAGRETVLRAYREAVCSNYRFLSFGDAMYITST